MIKVVLESIHILKKKKIVFLKSASLFFKVAVLLFIIFFLLLAIPILIISFLPNKHNLPNNFFLKTPKNQTDYILYSPGNCQLIKNIYRIGYCGNMVYGQSYTDNLKFFYFLLDTKTGIIEYPYLNFEKTKYYNYPMLDFAAIEEDYGHNITKVGLDKCE